ncbi:MAG TPA: VOC family protein [Aestuariivirgaceae bacterium]|jgi:catechol 2,3-dioxygenase-like lactoylglutathione lyase family enzyme
MLDHVGFAVSDLKRAREFYQKALSPLGIMLIYDISAEQTDGEAYLGFGEDQKPYFWVGTGERFGGRLHVAFLAKNREIVDRFHRAAIAAGGKDNGAPGLRPHYHKNYYGAFVLDPDGNNIEAVCHLPA